jgi:hypothetical protein
VTKALPPCGPFRAGIRKTGGEWHSLPHTSIGFTSTVYIRSQFYGTLFSRYLTKNNCFIRPEITQNRRVDDTAMQAPIRKGSFDFGRRGPEAGFQKKGFSSLSGACFNIGQSSSSCSARVSANDDSQVGCLQRVEDSLMTDFGA